MNDHRSARADALQSTRILLTVPTLEALGRLLGANPRSSAEERG
jgi:hypothetical protein